MGSFHMAEAEKAQIWELIREGLSVRLVCRRVGRASGSVRSYLASTGGVRLAAGIEREHQRTPAPVLPQADEHRRLQPRRPRRRRREAQQPASTDPELADTIRETRRGVALTP